MIKHILRTEADYGKVTSGSLIKLQHEKIRDFIHLNEGRNEKAKKFSGFNLKSPDRPSECFSDLVSPKVSEEIDDTMFKIIEAKRQDLLIVNTLAHLARFIKRFDIQLMTKYYDFTEDAGYLILYSALKQLKLLILNALPSAIQQGLSYKKPNEFIQRVMRESHCIEYLANLLQKLFPSGHSVDYSEHHIKKKLLCQLLKILAISVKNNKENQIYTFRNVMRIIQKYIGVKMKNDKHKDIALLSVVENCEEILFDPSLESIINQFLSELCSNDLAERMKKHNILSFLQIFCLFASTDSTTGIYTEKGIASTQVSLNKLLLVYLKK